MSWPIQLPQTRYSPYLPWALGGCITLGATLMTVRILRRPKDPQEIERLRRLQVNGVGRLAAGEIVDVFAPESSAPALHVVVYQYEVRGVQYEASQDMLPFAARLNPCAIIPGSPADVKYDPANPGNSIIACETWSGLR